MENTMKIFLRCFVIICVMFSGIYNSEANPELMEALGKSKLLAHSSGQYFKSLEELAVSNSEYTSNLVKDRKLLGRLFLDDEDIRRTCLTDYANSRTFGKYLVKAIGVLEQQYNSAKGCINASFQAAIDLVITNVRKAVWLSAGDLESTLGPVLSLPDLPQEIADIMFESSPPAIPKRQRHLVSDIQKDDKHVIITPRSQEIHRPKEIEHILLSLSTIKQILLHPSFKRYCEKKPYLIHQASEFLSYQEIEELLMPFGKNVAIEQALGENTYVFDRILSSMDSLATKNVSKQISCQEFQALHKKESKKFIEQETENLRDYITGESFIKHIVAGLRKHTNPRSKKHTQRRKAPSVSAKSRVQEQVEVIPFEVTSSIDRRPLAAEGLEQTIESELTPKINTLINIPEAQAAPDDEARQSQIESLRLATPVKESFTEEESYYELNEWWKKYQEIPQHKRLKVDHDKAASAADAEDSAAIASAFQVAIKDDKVLSFWEIMTKKRPFEELHKRDFERFLSEIHRQYRAYLGLVPDTRFSGIIKRTGCQRPAYYLPNLKPTKQQAYLMFSLPHFPHSGGEPLYPDLYDIFRVHFIEAGLI
jgi:hypothetical protein